MTIQDITQVIHLDDLNDVNEHLKDGWVILNTYTVTPDSSIPNNLMLIYSLGKTSITRVNQQQSFDYSNIDSSKLNDL